MQEVQQFLFESPEIEEFVIIDDAYYNDFVAEFPRNFVHSDKGYLRETEFGRAKAILQGKAVEALKPSNSFW